MQFSLWQFMQFSLWQFMQFSFLDSFSGLFFLHTYSWHTFLPSGCQFIEREKQSCKLGRKIYITWTAVHHKNVNFKYLFWIKFTRAFKVEITNFNSQSLLSKPNFISQKFAKSMQIFVYKSYFAKFSRSRLCKPPVDV